MRWNRITRSSAAIVAGLLVACSNKVLVLAPDAVVVNRTGKPIHEIRYRICGAADAPWAALPGSALERSPNTYLSLELPEECVDLTAHHDDGSVAGSQSGIKKKFPFRWVIY